MIGKTLAHYRILSLLGEGGMGRVYLAEDTKLQRNVALKILPPVSIEEEGAKKRLLREARAAAALDHPNICSIYEVGEADGINYIAMQYIKGETLETILKREPLNCEDAMELGRQIVEALAEAHDHNLIHRDIKPQNIMITPGCQVKMLDFGLAKSLMEGGAWDGEAETQTLLTQAGMIVGTVPYMSPEQVRGETLDARSDIFSFGAVLYEMLTGHRLFAAKTTAEIVSAILTLEPQPLASHSVTAPSGLEALLRKCLVKDKQQRYQTLREVARDFEEVRRGYDTGTLPANLRDNSAVTRRLANTEVTAKHRRPIAIGRLAIFAAIIVIGLTAGYAWLIRSPGINPATVSKPVNTPAYDYYLRGKVIAGSENKENNENAIRLLEQAVASDPNFALAYAELAQAYNVKAFYFASEQEKKKVIEDAEVAVSKALALNPNLAEGHLARGLLLWTHDNRFPHEQAIQSFKHALALNPNLDEAHNRLGVVYFHIGLLEESWDEIQKAVAINPANTNARFRFGVINIYLGRYEEAFNVFKSIRRESNPALVDRNVATALFQLGRTEEASRVVDEYLKSYPNDEGGNVTSVKAMLLAKAGKEQEAEETINRAINIGQGFGHFHHTAYNIASAYALLNKREQALHWLQFAADDGFPCYPFFEHDANLNTLRKDERFIAFMMKLKQQWERYRIAF